MEIKGHNHISFEDFLELPENPTMKDIKVAFVKKFTKIEDSIEKHEENETLIDLRKCILAYQKLCDLYNLEESINELPEYPTVDLANIIALNQQLIKEVVLLAGCAYGNGSDLERLLSMGENGDDLTNENNNLFIAWICEKMYNYSQKVINTKLNKYEYMFMVDLLNNLYATFNKEIKNQDKQELQEIVQNFTKK